MRILLTVHHDADADSGAAGTVLELAKAYRALGHHVQVLSYDDYPISLPLRAKNLLFPEFAALQLWRQARDVDVIDASTGDAWIWARVHRRLDSLPLLVTRSHGLEHVAHEMRLQEARKGRIRLRWRYSLYNGGLRLWEVAQSLHLADLVFLLNEQDLVHATEKLGVAAARCRIVRNGLPSDLLGLPVQARSTSDEPIRVAMLGSYIPRKGIDHAMPALGAVLERRPNMKLSMLGTGRPKATVLSDLPIGVRERVRVVEHYRRSELPDLLFGHHIALCASLSEGFGKATLEAMACGLAPVCTDSGGPTAFVQHRCNGLVILPGSRPAIESALDELANDRSLLTRLRAQAHSTAQQWSWSTVAAERLAMYERSLR